MSCNNYIKTDKIDGKLLVAVDVSPVLQYKLKGAT